MAIDQAIIDAIPRHPADPQVAYGPDLDPAIILPLVEDRILTGAIFKGFASKQEISAHVTGSLCNGFRKACDHFTGFFVSHEKGHAADLTHGTAVVRGLGMPNQGFGIETPGAYEGRKTLRDFLPDDWLIDKVQQVGAMVALPIKGYGYHIFQADAGQTKAGYMADWHTHEDIGAHITFKGAGLQWLPSYIDIADAKKNPERYEHLVQDIDVGDLGIMGRLAHRSSLKIPELGQLAAIAHGPYEPNGND